MTSGLKERRVDAGEWSGWPAIDDALSLHTAAPETLCLLLIGRDGRFCEVLYMAGQSATVHIPLATLARAVSVTGAASLFMAHSHPSGDPHPSRADIEVTRQVWRLARTLGASLQDHLILGRCRSFSFRANGLL